MSKAHVVRVLGMADLNFDDLIVVEISHLVGDGQYGGRFGTGRRQQIGWAHNLGTSRCRI